MIDTQQLDIQKFLDYYSRVNQFAIENGESLKIHTPGDVSISMTIVDRHLSSPGISHGGAIAGFMDSLLGSAALTRSLERGFLCATVEFKISYFRPAHLGDVLQGHARVVHEGQSLISCTAEIYLNDSEIHIASGSGTFNLYPFEKKKELFSNFK